MHELHAHTWHERDSTISTCQVPYWRVLILAMLWSLLNFVVSHQIHQIQYMQHYVLNLVNLVRIAKISTLKQKKI